MADYSEVQIGFEHLREALFADNGKGLEALREALDDCASGVTEEAINFFSNLWADIRFNTYIACFSEHDDSENQHGRLSMWRAFGGTDIRAAIVMKFPFSLV
jgi:hypothetical protein